MAEKSYEEAFQEWLGSQSGYTGKTKKAEFRSNWELDKKNQSTMNGIMGDGPTPFSVSGSAQENQGRLEGLQRAKILTGQNPYDIGKDYQQAYGNIKKRTEGSDTASELLRANKAGAVAEARDQLQSSGVKGGAAVGAVAQVERQKSYDVNNQMIQAQRQAQNDYLNATKANANFTQASEMNFGAMAAGKDVQAPGSNSNGFGGMSTVICTEMFRQGYMDEETFKKDQVYGMEMLSKRPDIYWGYRYLADPVVKTMKVSPTFSYLVSLMAIPWAHNMAGKKSLFGKAINFVGEPLCSLVGRYILGVQKYAIKEAYVTKRNR